MTKTFSFSGFTYQAIKSVIGDSGFGRVDTLTLAVCDHVIIYDRAGLFEINPRPATRWAIFRSTGEIQHAGFTSLDDAEAELDTLASKDDFTSVNIADFGE